MIIHQVWFDLGYGTDPPHASRRNSFRTLNPSAEYRLWHESDALELMNEACPHLLRLYNELPYGINRCDLFRYVLMYYRGGFYFDTDFRCLRSLEALVDPRRVILCDEWPNSSMDETVHNGALYSPKFHLFWQFVFDEIALRLRQLPERGPAVRRGSEVLKLTGTAMLRDVAVATRDVVITPHHVFCPVLWCGRRRAYVYPDETAALSDAHPTSYCALLPSPLTWRA